MLFHEKQAEAYGERYCRILFCSLLSLFVTPMSLLLYRRAGLRKLPKTLQTPLVPVGGVRRSPVDADASSSTGPQMDRQN